MSVKTIKILTAKMGLDSHDTGIKVISQLLKDNGMDVIYLGVHNTAEQIHEMALQEDVDAIGLSFLSGQHLPKTKELMEIIKKNNSEFVVIVGGVIPREDIPKLKEAGVLEVFLPGTTSEQIFTFLKKSLG